MLTETKQNNFGAQLRKLRQAQNFTLQNCANALNLEESELESIEEGNVTPPPDFIETVLDFFNLSRKEIMSF